MKRRNFLRGTAALVAAPLLPMPSLAAAPSGLSPQLILLSEHHAARHGTACAALFARRMGIPPTKAQMLANRLIHQGLATLPKAITPKAYQPKAATHLKEIAQKLADLTKKPPPDGEGSDLEKTETSVDLGEQTVE